MFEIYQLYNSVNGKSYVGQTTESTTVRWRKHVDDAKRNRPTRICKAIRKYGKESFERRVISIADNRDDLNNLEKVWIILLQTTNENCGYNICAGGDSRYIGEAGRAKMKAKLTGRKLSEEHRRNISAATKRRWEDPEYKARLSKKFSEVNIGKPKSEFHRKRMREGRLGMKLSPEHRANISKALNKFYGNEEHANAEKN